ncbi:MAG: hypothetical protein ACYSTI_13725, partial [Planctomycetota bacterium]
MDRRSPLLFVAALMGLLSPHITFAAIRGNADISYSERKTTTAGVTRSTWSLNQNYTLTLQKPITRTLTFTGNVSLTITETKDGEKNENIFPLFILAFSPPRFAGQWYNLNLNWQRTQTAPSEGANITNTNTNVLLSLNLPYKLVPPLSLSFNRTTAQDNRDLLDVVTNSIGFRTNYQFNFLETETSIRYSFNDEITENKVTEVEQDTLSHFVGASFSRSFWNNKVRTSENFGFRYTESTFESLGAPQRFDAPLPPNAGVSDDFTGPAFDATDPSFTNNALIDGNINASAGINLDIQDSNIAIGYNAAQTVFRINLNITTSLTKTEIDTLDFGWELFTSNDGIIWTFRGVQLPVYEEIPSQRFVFTFPETPARFFRLVNRIAPPTGSFGLPIEVTEMEARGFIFSTPSQSSTAITTRDFGGLSISFTPTGALRTSYNIA